MITQKNSLKIFVLSIILSLTFSCGEKKTETKNEETIDNSNPTSESKTEISTSSESTQSESTQPNAYSMMEVAFEGNPSTSEIKPMMEEVMKSYNLDVNEENLQKVASMLVSLRKESKVAVTEMEILKNIYQKGDRNVPLTTQAAISLMNLEQTK